MRVLSYAAFFTAVLLLSGCERDQTPPPVPPNPPNNRPSVEVHAPNVDVKTDKQGTSVTTPGADVHVEKKQP